MTRLFFVLLLASAPTWAQSSAKPEFEVAAIHPAPPYDGKGGPAFRVFCDGGPGAHDPELFTCQNINLVNLVGRAWQVRLDQIVAPDWMRSSFPWFNLNATIPSNTTKEQFQLMLQNLLTDRFKLAVHHENRETGTFDLIVGKGGPKFKQAAEPIPAAEAADNRRSSAPQRLTLDADGFPTFPPGSEGMSMARGKARIHQPRMTMEELAQDLDGQPGKPVKDATGLTSQYEIDIHWVITAGLPAAASTTDEGPSLEQALQEQLGLRLEPKKGEADFLVIDHAEKTPTEN